MSADSECEMPRKSQFIRQINIRLYRNVIKLRKSNERGHTDLGWLDSYHTFSFSSYHDRNNMGFRSLRVFNDDRVQPGQGFGTHAHDNMEIVSLVIEGALEHKDSMGNGSVIRKGEIQRMTAGTGVTHSEYNNSDTEVAHFLQIWIIPEKKGLQPGYEQNYYSDLVQPNNLLLIASPDAMGQSLKIHQDVKIYTSILEKDNSINHDIDLNRHVWLHTIKGNLNIDGENLLTGDSCGISEEALITIHANETSEFLLFDLFMTYRSRFLELRFTYT